MAIDSHFEKGHVQKTANWLDNYCLTPKQILRSIVVSEYAFRHLAEAKASGKLSQYIISILEFIPILGGIASLIEGIAARKILKPATSYAILTLPHEEIPADRQDLKKIQKTIDKLGMPLHVQPKLPENSSPLKTKELEELKQVFLDPDYACYYEDRKPLEKNLLIRAADLFQHISMEDMNRALSQCVQELNRALHSEGHPAYAVGFNCGKSSQWVASLALKDLDYLPEDWGNTPVNVGTTSFATVNKTVRNVTADTLVLFDDCSYSGDQIYNILFSLLKKTQGSYHPSHNKFQRIYVVIPFMSQGALDRLKIYDPIVKVITSPTKIKAFKDAFASEEIAQLKDAYVVHTNTNQVVYGLGGAYFDGNITACYTDWRTVPDSVSFLKTVGNGIKRINSKGESETVGVLNYESSTRPYALSKEQLGLAEKL